ncbi:hypothetical protein EDI_329650 [Entamoeba dispar SAW760]|uniref:Uncharacterized protein n=1 Tax=Entamoeba dispar (strain ATCC PRA-260 / SAW760) TaxID=370354 RepID=B0ENG4_ENTDS|nr:uncharacterized protein EDI_329650 [Entamoeba dispar SAW760]EDR23931.1 hypothetical protein EDI_329650 [Entamoeba dispar SAW760]|eukprot:EDR23931.1 hypothetical protein EDI_329650 [Entamoeba dispar SAW760]
MNIKLKLKCLFEIELIVRVKKYNMCNQFTSLYKFQREKSSSRYYLMILSVFELRISSIMLGITNEYYGSNCVDEFIKHFKHFKKKQIQYEKISFHTHTLVKKHYLLVLLIIVYKMKSVMIRRENTHFNDNLINTHYFIDLTLFDIRKYYVYYC